MKPPEEHDVHFTEGRGATFHGRCRTPRCEWAADIGEEEALARGFHDRATTERALRADHDRHARGPFQREQAARATQEDGWV